MSAQGCGAPAGGVSVAVDLSKQAVVQGKVVRDGSAVTVGYARLLNSGGDFVAEVPLDDRGGFRFFAAPGDWTVRVLAQRGVTVDTPTSAAYGRVTQLEVSV